SARTRRLRRRQRVSGPRRRRLRQTPLRSTRLASGARSYCEGRLVSVTRTVWLLPARTYVIETMSPGFFALTAAIRPSTVVILVPPTEVITSPPVGNACPLTVRVPVDAWSPAFAAGVPGRTVAISAPAARFR